MKILFALLIVSPAATELSSARSTLHYPLLLNAKQGSNNSHLLTSFGMTQPGFEPTTSRLWGGHSTDWANTPVICRRFIFSDQRPYCLVVSWGARPRIRIVLYFADVSYFQSARWAGWWCEKQIPPMIFLMHFTLTLNRDFVMENNLLFHMTPHLLSVTFRIPRNKGWIPIFK